MPNAAAAPETPYNAYKMLNRYRADFMLGVCVSLLEGS